MFSLQWTSIYQQKDFDQILMLSKHTTLAPANLSNATIYLGHTVFFKFSTRPARHGLTFMCPLVSLLKRGNLHPNLMETLKFSGQC